MKNLSRFAAAAGVASAGLGLFGLTAGPASAAPAATISPSTNASDCNPEDLNPTDPAFRCTRATVTATGFPANSRVALIECPTATVVDPGLCDNTTTDFGIGVGYSTDANGNFTTNQFPARKVPTAADNALGNDPGFVCDETTSCVVAVVTGTQFDFTLPKAFTQPFTFAAVPPPPPPNVPEVPWAAVLPLGALALCGGSFLVLRNRSRSSASAA